MTRKDYILIAEALRNSLEEHRNALPTSLMETSVDTNLENVFRNVANAFEMDNPHFAREHFLAVVRGEKSLTSRPAGKS